MCVNVVASQRWDVFLETRCKIQSFFVLVLFLIFLILVLCVGFRAHVNMSYRVRVLLLVLMCCRKLS